MLHIGFGFHLEMGLDEAQAFIAKRSELLHRCVVHVIPLRVSPLARRPFSRTH
jgi:hypothetical protein